MALGALKMAAILLVSPLLIVPRRAGPLYKRAAEKSLRATRLGSVWTGRHLKLLFKYLANHRPSLRITRARPAHVIQELAEQADEPVPASQAGGPRTVASMPPEPFTIAEEPAPEPRSTMATKGKLKGGGWQLPPLELLSKGESRPLPQSILDQMAKHIEDTLAEHRVEVAVDDIRTGPRVLRFGLVPGWVKKYRESRGNPKEKDEPGVEMNRVKVQSILVREKDLALALKTHTCAWKPLYPARPWWGWRYPTPTPGRWPCVR